MGASFCRSQLAQTAPKPKPKHHGCGIFGQILMVAVAVAVTLVLKVPVTNLLTYGTTTPVASGLVATTAAAADGVAATTSIAAGAIAGAAGSVASQGVGIAIGAQDKFSFTGVALAAISGGVGGAVGGSAIVKGLSPFESGALRGIIGNVATQGIAVATGLQNQFDWAGIAVAGVVGGTIGGLDMSTSLSGQFVSGMAGAVTGAAARSLLTGSDFGDNILRTLPDVIGNTIGNLAAGEIAGSGRETSMARYRRQGFASYADSGAIQSDGDIVVTATKAQVEAAKHGLGWRIADFLGFHGGPGGGGFDTSAIASSVAMTIRRAPSAAADFTNGLAHGVYNVGANVVTGTYHLFTTNPLTTARNTGYALAGGIDSILAAEDTPAYVQLGRAANSLSNASAYDLGYGVGNVGGNVALLVAPELAASSRVSYVGGLGNAGITAATRQATARSFYEAAGWSEGRISNHMAGIDFLQPVDVVALPQGELVVQHVAGPVGNYFAPLGTPAGSLGINPAGRVSTIFATGSDVSVLRSTAAPIVDTWTVPGAPFRASGGGTQYFTTNPDLFRRVN